MANTNLPELTLEDSADPTGNGQKAVVLTYTDTSGHASNIFFVKHGGQKLIEVIANMPSDAQPFFELSDGPQSIAAGKVTVR